MSRSRSRSPPRRSSSSSHRRYKKDPERYTQVYVAKLHRSTREQDLREAFSKFGKIRECALKYSFAFIDFEDHEHAVRAIKEMDGKKFVNGEVLLVEQSLPGGKKREKASRDDKCYNCNKRGHWAYECRSSRRRSRSRSYSRRYSRSRSRSRGRRYRSPSRSRTPPRRREKDASRDRNLREGRCFICKEKGHLKRDCPELNGGRSGARDRARSPKSRSRSISPKKRRERSLSRSRSKSRGSSTYDKGRRRSNSRSQDNRKRGRDRSDSVQKS